METLLINPPSNSYRKPEEHLGLAYLKSYAERNNHNVSILDCYLDKSIQVETILTIIREKACSVVGISPSIDSFEQSYQISAAIKEKFENVMIVWGGHLATFSAEELLLKEPSIDVIVRWEGEITFLELLNFWQNNIGWLLGDIPGIAFRQDGKIQVNPSRPLITDLDELPHPDRSYANLAVQQWSVTQISWSRWCYWNCSFCSINALYRLSDGSAWRGRSPKNIVDELEKLNKNFGIWIFKFVDDSFFWPWKNWRDRWFQIANEIIKRGLKIKFRISVRADNVELDLFQKLKEAWLYSLSIWIESWHNRGLRTFNKWITTEQNKKSLDILKELGIITLMGFIGFDPYTNMEEIEQNLSFLKETNFALTDIISKPLFVHAQSPIALKLLNEWRIDEKGLPNYKYELEDEDARKVLFWLKYWNGFNRDLYYAVSDMLTAPRITSLEQEKILLGLHRRMRMIDLDIYQTIISLVKNNLNDEQIKQALETEKEKYVLEWSEIEKIFLAMSS